MDFEEFKEWVLYYAEHGDVPVHVRDEFDRMIEEDERCSDYFDAHLKLEEYMGLEGDKIMAERDRVYDLSKSALLMIESGVSPLDVPKEKLDALVYVLGDRAVKAWQEKDYSEALSLLNQVLLYRSDDSMTLVLLGDVHSDMGEHKEAAGYYASALDSGGLEEESRPMVLSHLGLCHAQLGDFAKALENLEKAKGMAPEDAIVLNNLGVFYLMRSMYSEALLVLKKAEPLAELEFGVGVKTAAFYGNLAMAYYELGDKKNALHYIRAAIAIDPLSENLLHNEEIISGAKEGVLLFLI